MSDEFKPGEGVRVVGYRRAKTSGSAVMAIGTVCEIDDTGAAVDPYTDRCWGADEWGVHIFAAVEPPTTPPAAPEAGVTVSGTLLMEASGHDPAGT